MALSHAPAAEMLTTRGDEVGKALNEWNKEGTAAGFTALQYENRDGGHSPLPLLLYPSLPHYKPGEAEAKAKANIGPSNMVRPSPTIGNCSMAAPAENGGSLPRMIVHAPGGADFVMRQYLANNLMVYPEHRDYDPGANGQGGYGDLFGFNSPCFVITQGSSFSDMPVVKALLSTAAALRPEIQRYLIQQRILAPTLQAILRQNTKLVAKPEDYFSGRAHPPVFDPASLDEFKMVTMAQMMTAVSIPPLAFMEIKEEPKPIPGADFFEPSEIKSQAIATTPAFIARAYRSLTEEQEFRLSARRSVDTEKRLINYRWVLLQGDPNLVKIEPQGEGDEVRIRVRWHPAMIVPPTGIRSYRVDIGLFVQNALAASAPAIFSIAMLPDEQRFFDDRGRLVEVCYEAGNPEPGLPAELSNTAWLGFLEAGSAKPSSLSTRLLQPLLSKDQINASATALPGLRRQKAALDAVPDDEPHKAERSGLTNDLNQALAATLTQKLQGPEQKPESLHDAAHRAVKSLAGTHDLFLRFQEELLSLPDGTTLKTELLRLRDWGVLVEDADHVFHTTHAPKAWTDSDRYYLRQLNLAVLGQVLYPAFLNRSPAPMFTDPLLSLPKPWRDVFHYDAKGARTGWTRYYQGRSYDFNSESLLLQKSHEPQAVRYQIKDKRLIFEAPPSP